MKDVSGNHSKDRLFHLVHWLSITQKTAKDQSRTHYEGEIWEGDVLVADLEELETMDASEIYSERLNAKEVIYVVQVEINKKNS